MLKYNINSEIWLAVWLSLWAPSGMGPWLPPLKPPPLICHCRELTITSKVQEFCGREFAANLSEFEYNTGI